MKINSKWKRYLLYHFKWQIGAVVAVPSLYLFLDILHLRYWLAIFLFQLIGAIVFYPIDMWILSRKEQTTKKKNKSTFTH
jgi:putative flippase GtrA